MWVEQRVNQWLRVWILPFWSIWVRVENGNILAEFNPFPFSDFSFPISNPDLSLNLIQSPTMVWRQLDGHWACWQAVMTGHVPESFSSFIKRSSPTSLGSRQRNFWKKCFTMSFAKRWSSWLTLTCSEQRRGKIVENLKLNYCKCYSTY